MLPSQCRRSNYAAWMVGVFATSILAFYPAREATKKLSMKNGWNGWNSWARNIDQDPLEKSARPVVNETDTRVWLEPLEDGSYAVGLFNAGDCGKMPELYFRWAMNQQNRSQLTLLMSVCLVNIGFATCGVKKTLVPL